MKFGPREKWGESKKWKEQGRGRERRERLPTNVEKPVRPRMGLQLVQHGYFD